MKQTEKYLLTVHWPSGTVQTGTPARCWICSHLSSKLVWDARQILHLFWFSSPLLYNIAYLFVSHYCSSLSHIEFPTIFFPISLAVSLWPVFVLTLASQTSACRDSLHLQHTWGIKEGWNSLIRGWSEKKRRPPYSTALHLWYREILNETWVSLTENV